MTFASIALGLAGAPCLAADSYSCAFDIEDGQAHAALTKAGDNWQMLVAENGGAAANSSEFQPVKTSSDGTLYMTSMNFDEDADAVSLLSLAPDGTAFLSVHGAFPDPAAELFYGTCEERS